MSQRSRASQPRSVAGSVRPEDSASQAGRSSVTSSSVGVRRLELSAKKAAVLAEASLAQEQLDLEVEQTRLRQRMHQLDIKKRLAILDAEDQVLAQADVHECDDRHAGDDPVDGDGDIAVNSVMSKTELPHVSEPEVLHAPEYIADSTNDPEITFKTNLNPTVNEFMPGSTTDVVSWLKQGQMQNAQLIEAIRLPTTQLTHFSGDPISYWPFMRAFENCVASSLVDDGA